MRTSILILLAAATAGCFFKPGHSEPQGDDDDAPMIDAQELDAPPDTSGVDLCVANMAACTAKNGICAGGTCLINQVLAVAVTCPDRMPCQVNCTAPNACDPGVSCAKATTCKVLCTALACKDGGVDCSMSDTCTVRCVGTMSCLKGDGPDLSVECRKSNCDVTCDQPNACGEGVDVDNGGTCATHCCDGACGPLDGQCNNNNTCILAPVSEPAR